MKLSDLVSADAHGDFEHLRICHLSTHGCVKARTALLNHSEVEGCNGCNRLNMIVAGKVRVGGTVEIGIYFGNCGNTIESDGLGEGGPHIRIGCAAVANEPTRVDVEGSSMAEVARPVFQRVASWEMV
jgi:hypothetical protein